MKKIHHVALALAVVGTLTSCNEKEVEKTASIPAANTPAATTQNTQTTTWTEVTSPASIAVMPESDTSVTSDSNTSVQINGSGVSLDVNGMNLSVSNSGVTLDTNGTSSSVNGTITTTGSGLPWIVVNGSTTSSGNSSIVVSTPLPTEALPQEKTLVVKYSTPAGLDSIEFSTTVVNKTIISVKVKPLSTDTVSLDYQKLFGANVTASVVGKWVEWLKIDTVSWASLTTAAFNEYLAGL